MKTYHYFIGVDVSKQTLDYETQGKTFKGRVANTPGGIGQLLDRLEEGWQETLILCEATGGYESLLTQWVQERGGSIIVIQPRQARYFAKAMNVSCKTDAMDARMLSLFCQRFGADLPVTKSYPMAHALRQLVRRRHAVVAKRTAAVNQQEHLDPHQFTYHSLQREIDFLTNEEAVLLKEIRTFIRTHASQNDEILRSIAGIGEKVAAELLAELPEITELEPQQLTALAGLAPMNDDSGNRVRKRHIQGGRSRLRRMLYMAALTAVKTDNDLRALYERLMARGKPAKLALTAVARKLLLMAQAVLRRQSPWRPSFSA